MDLYHTAESVLSFLQDKGKWVKYADHCAEIVLLKMECSERETLLRAEVERLTYELKRCGDTGYRLNEAYATEWVKDDWDEIERLRAALQRIDGMGGRCLDTDDNGFPCPYCIARAALKGGK